MNTQTEWRSLLSARPADEAVCLSLGGALVNLRDSGSAIRTHFESKPADAFLAERMNGLLTEREVRRGIEIRGGRVTFDPFPSAALSESATWDEDPFQDPTWPWQLHNFAAIRYLLAALRDTDDRWYLERAERFMLTWLTANWSPSPPSSMSWNDHSTALRLENLIYFFEYARTRGLSDALLRGILAAVPLHAGVLCDESFYNRGSNHGLDQSYILFLAGCVFPEFEDAATWRQLGHERSAAEIASQFSSEGVHIENSPTYHFWMLQRALQIDRLFRHYSQIRILPHLETMADGALEFLAYITKPDGCFPLLGDTVTYRPQEQAELRALARLPHYANFAYVVSQGRHGSPPLAADRVFPDSGYAILRSGWPPADDFASAVHVVFKAGVLGRFHRHDDDLSVVLYAHGEDWLVDSGLYRYHEDDPVRRYVRSVRGHNVPTIDDLEPRRQPDDVDHSHIDSYELRADGAVVSGSHTLYDGISISRRVEFFRTGRLRIEDSIAPAAGTTHVYRVLFHVPDDKQVVRLEDSVLVRSTKSGRTLRIRSEPGRFEKVYVVSGQTEPSHQGWSSPTHGTLAKTQCVTFEVRSARLDSRLDLEFE